MKVCNIFGIFVLLFCVINQIQANSLETLDLEVGIPQKINTLGQALNNFRSKNPQLNYGITSIENLYNSGLDIEQLYGSKESHLCLREILFKLEILAGGSCGALRCLSIFHPNIDAFGKALIGCYAGKAIFWGADALLNNSAKQASIALINTAQTDPKVVSEVSKMINEINGINFSPVLEISEKVISMMNEKDLSEDEQKKLARLQTLTKKMDKLFSFKKFLVTGGKVLSFVIGAATGITIAATGQYSDPSYWLTLITGSFEPIIDCINTRFTSKPVVRKYITISEIIYLCDNFIKDYEEVTL